MNFILKIFKIFKIFKISILAAEHEKMKMGDNHLGNPWRVYYIPAVPNILDREQGPGSLRDFFWKPVFPQIFIDFGSRDWCVDFLNRSLGVLDG